MTFRRTALACACLGAALLPTAPARAQAPAPTGVDMSCYAPAGNPEPGTQEWLARDAQNQYCASLRLRDQQTSPAFGYGNVTQGAALYVEQLADELATPTRPQGGITTRLPGAKAADPFRTIKRWTAANRGRVVPVSFKATNGSTLRGHVFVPPASVRKPKAGYPGVVITDGSVQAYEELYFWAAEDLAEAGYMVMTYDVQGQGDSDLFGDDCPGACSGVPYQQDYNFVQGAEDSLSLFLASPQAPSGGSYNPFIRDLDKRRVAIAGHSLGARAVSLVGQCDTRVRTIVAWDNLQAIESCDGVLIPAEHRNRGKLIRTSALALTNDYMFNTQPQTQRPDPDAKTAGYRQVAAAGLDAQIVALRNATHLAYTYIPLVFQSNQLGERMASYYTKAWLNLKLKGRRSALSRLTAASFDDSVDRTSIGAGTYDPTKVVPGDPFSGNVPYRIDGIPVRDAVSFYYRSAYSLRGGGLVCEDIRAGCATAAARKRAARAYRRAQRAYRAQR